MQNIMKQTMFLTGLSLLCLFSGGCVATTFKHEIAVERDADGKIIKTTETEGIEQPGAESMGKMHFKTLELPK